MQKISRRNFIKTGLAAAAVGALNLQAAQDDEIKWDAEFDVLVVGSGLSANVAGIVAAGWAWRRATRKDVANGRQLCSFSA